MPPFAIEAELLTPPLHPSPFLVFLKWGHRPLAEAASSRHVSRQHQVAIDRFGEMTLRTRLFRCHEASKRSFGRGRQSPESLTGGWGSEARWINST